MNNKKRTLSWWLTYTLSLKLRRNIEIIDIFATVPARTPYEYRQDKWNKAIVRRGKGNSTDKTAIDQDRKLRR